MRYETAAATQAAAALLRRVAPAYVAGRTEVFLFTEERNARALAVYDAAGYRPDGQVRESDFHGEPLRELRLVKALRV